VRFRRRLSLLPQCIYTNRHKRRAKARLLKEEDNLRLKYLNYAKIVTALFGVVVTAAWMRQLSEPRRLAPIVDDRDEGGKAKSPTVASSRRSVVNTR
jgi:hypothetical protein